MRQRGYVRWGLVGVPLLCLLIIGCGKEEKKSPVSPGYDEALLGTWQTQRFVVIPDEYELTPEHSLFILIQVTLKEDHTLFFERTEAGQTTQGTGTWSATANTATITLSDGTILSGTYTLSEDKMTLTLRATIPFDNPYDNSDLKVPLPVTVVMVRIVPP